MTARVLKALFWLRWRLLVNGMKGGRRRDKAERFSRLAGVAVPAILAVLALPVMLGLAALGGFAGWALVTSQEAERVVVTAAAFVLLAPLLFIMLNSLDLAGTGSFARSELLRLLPIPTGLLRNLEFLRALTDPVFLLFTPAVLLLPVGVLAGARPAVALVALAAGLAFLAFLIALSGLVSLVAQLLLRDRRRGEVVMLLVSLGLVGVSLLPQLLGLTRHQRALGGDPSAAHPRVHTFARSGTGDEIPLVAHLVPSVAYAASLDSAAQGRWGAAAAEIGPLLLLAAAMTALSLPVYRRLTQTPARGGGSRSAARVRFRAFRFPLVSAAASAVALAQLRLFLRTVRGKMALISPPLLTTLVGLAFRHNQQRGPDPIAGPYGAAVLGVFGVIGGAAAIACNQFAADGPGLVLEFLQPLSNRALLRGKALATFLIAAPSLVAVLIPLWLIFPGMGSWLLATVLFGGLALQIVMSPLAAILAAVFPKTVNLGRLGQQAQPHGAAALIYYAAFVAGAAGTAVLTWLCVTRLGDPWFAAAFAGLAVGAALLLAPGLFSLAERVVESRRENLALVAMGR